MSDDHMSSLVLLVLGYVLVKGMVTLLHVLAHVDMN